MLAPRIQKIQSARVKKLQDRVVKLAEDERRTDGTAIRHRPQQMDCYTCFLGVREPNPHRNKVFQGLPRDHGS